MSSSQGSALTQVSLPAPTKLFTRGVTIILICMVAGFALLCYGGETALRELALHPRGVFAGKVWQLLTYAFLNTGCGLIFNALVVLFFGSAIEREWGTRSFVALWVVSSAACGLLWIIISFVAGREMIGLGFTPMAMLWHAENKGQQRYNPGPGWRAFQRRWARPAIIHALKEGNRQ